MAAITAFVRRWDRDRYQTALFAPAEGRAALFALYAFNCEIARVRDRVSEPTLGRIRLEWWRETIADAYCGAAPRHHPVAQALNEVIRSRAPSREHFDRLIGARALDLEGLPPANLAALEDYAEATSSRLMLLALEVLDDRSPNAAEAAKHAGIAYALVGLLRALPAAARTGRCNSIPADIARRNGLTPQDLRAASRQLRAAVAEVAGAASRHLEKARTGGRATKRTALAALLPTVIAARALTRLARTGFDPFDPALAEGDPLQSWRLALAAWRRRF